MINAGASGLQEIRHFHLFCGLGGGAKGFNNARSEAMRVGSLSARYRCVGGIDVDAASIRDFTRAAGVPGTVLDLFDAEQYEAFHGHAPPSHWRMAMPHDIQAAAGGERPHVVFLSAPCKGFSGLLSETRSKTEKYQALNRLTLRGVWLMLEAWAGDPPELVLFENVPRIANRGRKLLDQIGALLRSYGYMVAETTHDCGELGGLAQSRKRFLLVARHGVKVPPFLYEPPKRALRGVGEILGRMPMPGLGVGGPMHRVPSLQWQTWVRLAFVEAGSDWRSLNKLAVTDGKLADYLIVPEMRHGTLGVQDWADPSCTIGARSGPTNNAYSVADPRFEGYGESAARPVGGVGTWDQPASTVTGQRSPAQGRYSVADPRAGMSATKHNNCFRIMRWDQSSQAVTGGAGPSSGGLAVADPRGLNDRRGGVIGVLDWQEPAGTIGGESLPSNGTFAVADPRSDGVRTGSGKYRVTGYDEAASTVISASTTGQGAFAVADVRMGWDAATGHGNKMAITPYDAPATTVTGARFGSGALCVADPRPNYGEATCKNVHRVTPWEASAGTVTSAHAPSNGALCVADPRPGGLGKDDNYLTGGHYGVMPWAAPSGAVSSAACHDNGRWSVADPRLPAAQERMVAIIQALDGTWHRPFTTLELAALQSLIDPEEFLQLDGMNDQDWRERIGNAVPPDAAQAIAETMGRTLLLAWSGEKFMLSNIPIWVQPIAVALSVKPAPAIEGDAA